MKYGIYAIRDKKTEFYSPIVQTTKDAAVRWFAERVNVPGTINFAPEDFSLYCIGEYDASTGQIFGMSDIEFICKAESVMKGEDKNA